MMLVVYRDVRYFSSLLGISLDPVKRSAEVRVAYYSGGVSQERQLVILRFTGVSHFNQIVDLDQLECHAGAGNISNWVSGESPGVSYIYLVRGLIVVTAASVQFVADA